MTAGAVTAAAFAGLLRPLLARERPAAIAVAVSGGADSLALALLAADWARRAGVALTAFTVDHRLRPGSTAEARQVVRWLRGHDIPCRILSWTGPKPAANRQEAARIARYDLLARACAKNNIRHLLLAHHRDDQAETLLLRALRGSGVDGLAAMAPRRALADGLVLLRPLLDIPKARLLATLARRRQPWIEDPSNANPAFARVRVRQALDALAGHDAAARAALVTHLAATAANLARARAALEEAAADLLRSAARFDAAGHAWLDAARLEAAGDEIALRALSRLLLLVGGAALPPRLERLQRLREALRAPRPAPATLQRCLLRPQSDGMILVCREARHLPPPLSLSQQAGRDLLWDGRIRVTMAPGVRLAGLTLTALGSETLPPDATAAAAQPPAILPGQPALWRGRRLLALPLLGWGRLPAGLALRFPPA